MKIISSILALSFLIINLYADKNWIQIEPINKAQIVKQRIKPDVDLSQIEPINKMMKNVTVIKQLVDIASKKEKVAVNDKNWFVLNSEVNK